MAHPEKPVNSAMLSVVVTTLFAGSKAFGKKLDPAVNQAWAVGLRGINATSGELADAASYFLINSAEFPSVAEVCGFIAAKREADSRKRMIEQQEAEYRAAKEKRDAEADAAIQAMADKRGITTEEASREMVKLTRERLHVLFNSDVPGVRFAKKLRSIPGEIVITDEDIKANEAKIRMLQEGG